MSSDEVRPTRLRELIQPLGHTICQTLGLESAERRLREIDQNYVVITNMSDRALGVVTDNDIEYFKEIYPQKWAFRRCAGAVQDQPRLSVDDTVDDAIEVFSQGEVRPLLIFAETEAVGVLRPTEVFQWCAEHRPSVLDQLAARVCQ